MLYNLMFCVCWARREVIKVFLEITTLFFVFFHKKVASCVILLGFFLVGPDDLPTLSAKNGDHIYLMLKPKEQETVVI